MRGQPDHIKRKVLDQRGKKSGPAVAKELGLTKSIVDGIWWREQVRKRLTRPDCGTQKIERIGALHSLSTKLPKELYDSVCAQAKRRKMTASALFRSMLESIDLENSYGAILGDE